MVLPTKELTVQLAAVEVGREKVEDKNQK